MNKPVYYPALSPIVHSKIGMLLLFTLLSPFLHAAEPVVFATSYPLGYFAQRISGQGVTIMMPEEVTPGAAWRPTLAQVQAMQSSALVLVSEKEREDWLSRVSLPSRLVTDVSAGMSDQLIKIQGVTHSHGPDGEHAHGQTASNPWLDLSLAAHQARAVYAVIRKRGLDDNEELRERFNQLESDLLVLDAKIRSMMNANEYVDVLATAPGYEYLARRYGLHLEIVKLDSNVVFDEKIKLSLEQFLQSQSARWMIWPEQPLRENIEWLRRNGVESVVVDTGFTAPEEGDFVSLMRSNAAELIRILESP